MKSVQKNEISLETANLLIDKAIEEAAKGNFSIVATVVNKDGVLIALKKMDNAVTGPVDVSIKKARTAALFGFDSKAFGEIAQPGQPIYSIENTNGGLISFGGGVTLKQNDEVIGALGVAGASVDDDERIAKVAVHHFVEHLTTSEIVTK
ncbi:heme-binding protein [Pedobacter chinensis]|uniref:Heme-binding protein n=1 Tax=Pedobacter chinensis TaxID=2282421 RepID=A0A369PZ37_9SPHI|nr:heme-binding protein [Pedobacter chinensis]RDC55348.1 heme-binding protein [Pedobacter chinensis]